MQQIHDSERDFVHHIDPAQRGIKFHAIEGNGLLVNEDDIAEMQIAVALAHEALRVASLEMLPAVSIFFLRGLAQRDYTDRIFAIRQQDLQSIKDLKCRRIHGSGGTKLGPWVPPEQDFHGNPQWLRPSCRCAAA